MKETNDTMMQYFEWYLPNDCMLWKSLLNVGKDLKKLQELINKLEVLQQEQKEEEENILNTETNIINLSNQNIIEE